MAQHTTQPRTPGGPSRAFTLVEAAVSIVIVGVMLTVALSMLGSAAQARRRTATWREGESIARSLMVEVQQSSYGSTSGLLGLINITLGTNRTSWSTIDQYNGFSDGPPTDRRGASLTDYAGWTRQVTVERVDPANPTGAAQLTLTDTGLKRITVTVRSPKGELTKLVALRSRWGLVEAGAAQPGIVLAGVRIKAVVGSGGKSLNTAVTVPNCTSESVRVTSLAGGGN